MFSWTILPLNKAISICQNSATFTPEKMFSLSGSGFLILVFFLNPLLLLPPVLRISILLIISPPPTEPLFIPLIQKVCLPLSPQLPLTLQLYLLSQNLSLYPGLQTHSMQTRSKFGLHNPIIHPSSCLSHTEPFSVKQVMDSPICVSAIKQEYDVLIKTLGIWFLYPQI